MGKITHSIQPAIDAVKGKGAFGVIGGMFITRAVAFVGSIILVRLMSKSDYGILSSLENVYTYVYLLAGYGLNNAVLRWMVIKKSDGEKKAFFRLCCYREPFLTLHSLQLLSLRAY